MDGFPKTYDQAKALYEELEEDGEALGTADPLTVPELVIDFVATEDFLKQRMMSLPEEVVQVSTQATWSASIICKSFYKYSLFQNSTVSFNDNAPKSNIIYCAPRTPKNQDSNNTYIVPYQVLPFIKSE